jgi:hypothetical protein
MEAREERDAGEERIERREEGDIGTVYKMEENEKQEEIRKYCMYILHIDQERRQA